MAFIQLLKDSSEPVRFGCRIVRADHRLEPVKNMIGTHFVNSKMQKTDVFRSNIHISLKCWVLEKLMLDSTSA